MQEFYKRIRGGLWISFAGFLATVIGLTLEHLDAFNLSTEWKTVALILGTAIISQITRYLNSK